jgi:hypothetical protein
MPDELVWTGAYDTRHLPEKARERCYPNHVIHV